MDLNLLLVTLMTWCYHVSDVTAYSNAVFSGSANVQACENMTPNHGVQQQTRPCPYELIVEGDGPYWIMNSGFRLTLRSKDGTPFKGFMLQARMKNNYAKRAGDFSPVDGTKINCDDDRAFTHMNNNDKTSLTFIWNAPSTSLVGDIQFLWTVVRNKQTFWVNQTSDFYPTYYDYMARPKTTTPVPGSEKDDEEETGATAKDGGTSGSMRLVPSFVVFLLSVAYSV